jgi:phage terminase small subunit
MGSPINLSEEQVELAAALTQLQRKYAINLAGSDMSQREAYKAAGGQAKTETAQDSAASTMLSNVKVRAFYDSLLEAAQSDAVMTREEALSRLTKSAKITIKDVCDFKNVLVGEDDEGHPVYQTVWTIKNSEDIPDHIAASIKSVQITKSGPKIELYDSHGAIKQICEMQGWEAPKKQEILTQVVMTTGDYKKARQEMLDNDDC